MEILTQAIISGLVMGAVYAIMTIGLTLVYGCLRTLNMAQGAYGMVGGYVAWLALTNAGVPAVVSVIPAGLVAALFGVATHAVSVRPLVGRKDVDFEMTAYISTMVVSILLANGATLLFTGRNKAIAPLIDGGFRLYGSVSVQWHSVVIALVALVTLGGLHWFLTTTRQGLSILATAQEFDAARLMGVKVPSVYYMTMALAGAFGGIAGVLLAPLYFVNPTAGDLPLLKGLIIAIFAGLGSIKGTIYAALLVGLVEALSAAYFGSAWSLPVLFVLIVTVMIIRPYGLFGLPSEERL